MKDMFILSKRSNFKLESFSENEATILHLNKIKPFMFKGLMFLTASENSKSGSEAECLPLD